MVTVGIRELKQQASELIRMVRETGSQVQVTHRGRIVALVIPVTPVLEKKKKERAWARLDELAAEVGVRWPEDVSASKAVSESRR